MSGFNPYDKTHCEVLGWVITAVITLCYVIILRVIWYDSPDPITGSVERTSKRRIKEDELPPEIKEKLGLK